MKRILIAASLVVLNAQCGLGDLLIRGATLSNGSSFYQLTSDNGLDYDDPNWFGAGIALDVAVESPTSAVLTPGFFSSLTPGHMWYAVYPDQPIDPALVLGSTTAFHVGFFGDYDHVVEQSVRMNVSVPFLLGFWIAKGPSPEPSPGDVFGWAELVYVGTELHLLDSAAENSRPGIIAGRYEAIPEPSPVLLLVVGAMGLYGRMRRA